MATPALNPNSFGLNPVRGLVDWSIQRRGIMTVQVSANQATALVAGMPVILDSAATGAMPQVIGAGNSDIRAFYVAWNAKQDSFVAGDIIEVAGMFGPVIWLKADATIAMGATVEDVIVDSAVQTLAAAKPRGIALLNGVSGNLVPVMLVTPAVVAS